MGMTRRGMLAAAAMVAAGPALAENDAPLRVLCTGATERPVRELALIFTHKTGRSVLITTGNAAGVARRLRDGEAADLILNGARRLAAMAGVGAVDGTTIVELGRMRIGLGYREGAPSPDISTPGALRATLLAAPAIAYPDPAGGNTIGIHLLRMLEAMGLGDTLAPRSRLFAQGTDAVKTVAQGQATLVMAQIGEILAVPGVVLAGPLPEAMNLVTPYAAAIPMKSPNRAAALAFLQMLAGPEGQARFRAAGFTIGEAR